MSAAELSFEPGFYIAGGTLRRDASCYVERQADDDLYDSLRRGEFCYVLTARQMGKSSLMVRTAARLREAGVGVAVLDLTAIGQNLDAERWYYGLLSHMGQQLELEDEFREFWLDHQMMGPLQRWMKAVREVLLPRYLHHRGQVVIFIDEIDAVRSLPFSTDEFFAAIREFYNRRTEDEELQRLNFCLLGVASPSDLIRDTRTTPFNIGRRIELNDFTEREAAALAQGLRQESRGSVTLLKRILYWTGGHPYLTQRLCLSIAETNPHAASPAIGRNPQSNPQSVDGWCSELFLSPRARERDDNLLFVRERMLRSEVDLAGLLHLYDRAHSGRRVPDDETNPLVSILRLSGITRVETGCHRVRNRIYAQVFDRDWVKTNMPDAEARRQRAAFRRGLLRAGGVAAVIIAVMAALVLFAVRQRNLTLEEQATSLRFLYAAQVNLAQQAWEDGEISRMEELLSGQMPRPGREDLRGFEWYHLWRLSQNSMLVRHANAVMSVAFSLDGRMLATGSWDHTVKLWDVATRQELHAFNGHTDKVQMVAFSPDGRILASGGNDGTVKLCDVLTGQEVATLKGHADTVFALAFSPDGERLAVGYHNSSVRVWEVATVRELPTPKWLADKTSLGAHCLKFSPDGSLLAVRLRDESKAVWQTETLWETATGRELVTFRGHGGGVSSMAFSPDGRRLATIKNGSIAELYQVGSWQKLITFRGQTNVSSVAFSPDGKTLATGSWDRTVKLWDVATGQALATLQGHAATIRDVVFSPDGRTLASGSDDGTAVLWEVDSVLGPTVVKGQTTRGSLEAASSVSQELATGNGGGTIALWQIASKQAVTTLERHISRVYSVAFLPDSKKLATASKDSSVKLWDVTTGQELTTLIGHASGVMAAQFSPDGKTLATGSEDGTVRLWDTITGRELATLRGSVAQIWSIAFSHDGKRLAVRSEGGIVKFWDTVTGTERFTLKSHSDKASTFVRYSDYPVAISPDGRKLAAANAGNTVKLWDEATGQELTIFTGHTLWIKAMQFSPDGKTLATAGEDKTVKLWDVTTGQELATLKGHSMRIYSVAFSPDGKRLATSSGDGTVKLWEVSSRQELITLKGHLGPVDVVVFSPDGKTLATGGADGLVRLWRTATN